MPRESLDAGRRVVRSRYDQTRGFGPHLPGWRLQGQNGDLSVMPVWRELSSPECLNLDFNLNR